MQIVGRREVAYLNNESIDVTERRISRIVTLDPPVLIVADGQSPPDRLVALCDRADIPLFVTAESAGHVIDLVRDYLGQHFAERTTRHGVFMDILGLGVLLTGESGLGKSELGLELISRGHGLVADDAVDLYRVSQTALEGRCPELLMNLLEVRGIGLLDIKAIFGETAVRRKMRLKLIVHLVRKETMDREFERLPYEPLNEEILEVAGAKDRDRRRRRPQPGRAGRGGGAQHDPAAARHRHLHRVHRAPPQGDEQARVAGAAISGRRSPSSP